MATDHSYPGAGLFHKTELRIQPLSLQAVNLTHLAAAVAGALSLEPAEVYVIDARDNLVTFDVLRPSVDPRLLVGREAALLAAIAAVPGVTLTGGTRLHSQGVLGWVALREDEAGPALDRAARIADEVRARLARQVRVISTGPEVASGQIEDTNASTIRDTLGPLGYTVRVLPPQPDDADRIAVAIRAACDDGCGLVITTGGVGAEAKDQTLEALAMVDPGAALPYIVRFVQGTGRHAKDGVRVGVGRRHETLVVCLPGPNDEVRAGIEALLAAIATTDGTEAIAAAIAHALRARLPATGSKQHHHHRGHEVRG